MQYNKKQNILFVIFLNDIEAFENVFCLKHWILNGCSVQVSYINFYLNITCFTQEHLKPLMFNFIQGQKKKGKEIHLTKQLFRSFSLSPLSPLSIPLSLSLSLSLHLSPSLSISLALSLSLSPPSPLLSSYLSFSLSITLYLSTSQTNTSLIPVIELLALTDWQCQ